ncbi:MAG: S9 family peptidase [Opitutaceae bacterium]
MKLIRSLLLGGLAAVSLAAADSPTGVIPLEDFFRPAAFSEIRISPGGTKVAALSKWKEHDNLYVIDLKTKKPVQLTGLDTQDVARVMWVGDDRLIFTCREDGYGTGGIFAIDADGKNSRALAPSAMQQSKKGVVAIRSTEFLDFYGDSTEEILVVSNERRELDPDVYRMNVRTGIKQMVASNPGDVKDWLADGKGVVRVGVGVRGRETFVVYRDTPKAPWREVYHVDFLKGTLEPLAFDQDNKLIYVRSSVGRDTAALCLFDPNKGEVVRELFADPIYDADEIVQSQRDRALLGYHVETEKERFVWTDPNRAKLQALLDQELPGTENQFVSSSLDEVWHVVIAHGDRVPGTYYLFNAKELTLERLIDTKPWLKPSQLAAMQPITYTARDGLTIRGYLTLPIGREPKNLPLVVNPHGGPWARDSWGFVNEVQFLASRGYAVLQVNFRGSIGYGRKFMEAGYGQWGLKMQDDITDGVKWTIAQGIADPSRVAIYGASYGGYAAMAGLAFTPELYCCGVDYVGVTDIALLLKTLPKGWSPQMVELMTGNLKTDRERIEAASVNKHADRIRVPVFFAYGELDDRIDMRHATKLANQLRSNGVAVTWMSRANEAHGYYRWENKIDFYTTLEKFLAENTGLRDAGFGQIGESKVVEMPATLPAK